MNSNDRNGRTDHIWSPRVGIKLLNIFSKSYTNFGACLNRSYLELDAQSSCSSTFLGYLDLFYFQIHDILTQHDRICRKPQLRKLEIIGHQRYESWNFQNSKSSKISWVRFGNASKPLSRLPTCSFRTPLLVYDLLNMLNSLMPTLGDQIPYWRLSIPIIRVHALSHHKNHQWYSSQCRSI